jgi:cytochrome c553
MRLLIPTAVLAALLPIGVALAAPPTATPATPPGAGPAAPAAAPADPMAYARGARAWAQTCARCHGMRDPKEASDREWSVITTHMRLRAGLDAAQVRDITVFLQGSN